LLSNRFLRTAVVFFVVGVCMGMYMGITHDFRFVHVHAHLNLLGWVALGLAGLIYAANPQLEEGRWVDAHYWLHTVGLVLFMGGFAYGTISGSFAIVPVALGSSMVAAGVLVFAINVMARIGRRPQVAR
jgi:cbb3-type cytochrome oxidase subunit 1